MPGCPIIIQLQIHRKSPSKTIHPFWLMMHISTSGLPQWVNTLYCDMAWYCVANIARAPTDMPRSVRVTGDRQTNKCKTYWQQHQWKPPSSPLFGQFHKDWTNRNSQIKGCAVAQHCCNDDQQSQWENGDLTPCRSETPENFITEIGHIDYVAGGNTHAKFYGNRPSGVRPTNSQNITSCDFV